MDGAEVGVLEETDEVRLGSLLKRQHGVALEAEIGLRIVGMGTRLNSVSEKIHVDTRCEADDGDVEKGVANFFWRWDSP